MRTTASTIQALERLCQAAGWELTRDGSHFVVHFPRTQDDLSPVGKTSPRALALAASALRLMGPEGERIRDQVCFNPGWTRDPKSGRAVLAISDMVSWEEDALAWLADPYRPQEER